jgi:hypothetical protein
LCLSSCGGERERRNKRIDFILFGEIEENRQHFPLFTGSAALAEPLVLLFDATQAGKGKERKGGRRNVWTLSNRVIDVQYKVAESTMSLVVLWCLCYQSSRSSAANDDDQCYLGRYIILLPVLCDRGMYVGGKVHKNIVSRPVQEVYKGGKAGTKENV